MLEFARGISFGMRVGNLLELERALAGDGVVHAASEIKKLLRLEMDAAEFFGQTVPTRKLLLDSIGKPHEALEIGSCDFRCHAPPLARQEQRHEIQDGQLRSKTLRRRVRQFRSGPRD